MTLNCTQWNVVVVGHWNRAILTPSGIAKRLFNLAEGSDVQMEVMVPLDEYGPYQVKHNGLTVIAASDRLIIQANPRDYDSLQAARQAALNAISNLPETPFLACGFNLCFESNESLVALDEVTSGSADDRLSDAGLEIISRTTRRKLKWNQGFVNISATLETGGKCNVQINFDLKSKHTEEIKQWLGVPIGELKSTAESLLTSYLNIDPELINHGN